MGRRPTLLERKDMHAKLQHVRKRPANFPAAQSEDQTVVAMIGRGKATARQLAQGLNRMMNGRDPVNAAWLTLLSQVYGLPTIRAEDWYELSDADFFRKVDLHICHDPIDVLMALAEERADLRLEILRTSPLWRDRPPPAAEAYTSTAERSMEVGTPRYRRRLIETVAPGDGIRLLAGMTEGSSVEVVNVDGPEGGHAERPCHDRPARYSGGAAGPAQHRLGQRGAHPGEFGLCRPVPLLPHQHAPPAEALWQPIGYAYTLRASLWTLQHAYDKAEADYQSAMHDRPDSPTAYNNFAWIVASTDWPGRASLRTAALSAAQRAVALQEGSGDRRLTHSDIGNYKHTLACLYADDGDFGKAIATEQEAVDVVDSSELEDRLNVFKGRTPKNCIGLPSGS